MRLSRPVHVIPGLPKPYQNEPPNAWIFRILDLPIPGTMDVSPWYITDLGTHGICLYDESSRVKPIREIHLPPERQIALETWIRRQLAPTKDLEGRAIVVILTDPERTLFILQIKDEDHPLESYRGKRSLVSATRVSGESITETIHRDLYQEFIDPRVADDILRRMFALPQRMLYSPQRKTMVLCAWYVAIATSTKHFMYWVEKLLHDPGVTQAIPTCLSLHEVRALAEQECENPGSSFISGQHQLLLEAALEI
ncbi:TPA: hypothetical protein DDZ01_02755 [Candidatus Uhrbacteria bacterium]|nr:MAG: hypothetical protein A2332_03660 [Candidatus Uhrbacteria bacterium RIFOXYB2_FULL_41_18]HBK34890.1 hypothetical protein [Candidatus Uhrbacteria bacterium]HCB56137.1 hypothetical protein [Candidatus Uhrbacteria bacterium]